LLSVLGWLQAVEGDETMAYCAPCKRKLPAHFKDLERHCKTEKHKLRHNAVVNGESATAVSKSMLHCCRHILVLSADLLSANTEITEFMLETASFFPCSIVAK